MKENVFVNYIMKQCKGEGVSKIPDFKVETFTNTLTGT